MPIPDDFPRAPEIASLAGAQPKVAVRMDANTGKYVSTPADEYIEERHEVCIDLVAQLVSKCRAKRKTKYSQLSEVQILERLLAQLLGTAWGSPAEMKWVVRRTASELGWNIPAEATVLRVMLGEPE